MRALLLALVCSCTVADLTAAGEPGEAEAVSRSTIAECPIGEWCVELSIPSGLRIKGIFAIDEDNVYAVGNDGTILSRINGTSWTQVTSGTTSNLRSVWGASPTDVWAGYGTGILHFDGTSWSPVNVQASNVDAIWGTSANDVWFTSGSRMLHWNGSSFTSFSVGGLSLEGVSGTGPSDVWVAGENAAVHRYNGTGWSVLMPSIGSSLITVLEVSPTDVWVTAGIAGKEASHYNGSKWTTIKTAPIAVNAVPFQSMVAFASNDIWAAGNSSIGHWDGSAWSLEQPFGTMLVWSVTRLPGHLWVAGDGVIAHRQF